MAIKSSKAHGQGSFQKFQVQKEKRQLEIPSHLQLLYTRDQLKDITSRKYLLTAAEIWKKKKKKRGTTLCAYYKGKKKLERKLNDVQK